MQLVQRFAAHAAACPRLAPSRAAVPISAVRVTPSSSYGTFAAQPLFQGMPRHVCMAAATEDAPTQEDLSNSSSIFINNLSWAIDSQSLGNHLQTEIGGLLRANVMMRDGRSRGIAIADFESPELAQAAVEKLNESTLDGRTIGVRIAEPRPPRDERRYGDRPAGRDGRDRRDDRRERREPRDGERRPPRDPETLLYVGNLSWGTTWQGVKETFADAGYPVAFADVKKDQDGRSRGFAVVAFDDAGSAQAAADALDQSELDGRRINVRRFNPEPREPRGE